VRPEPWSDARPSVPSPRPRPPSGPPSPRRVFPHSPDTLSNAGLLAAQTDDRRAEALHRRAVALAPRSATALYNLAAHVGGDEAAGLYRRALASDPEHTFAHFNLAMCLEETDELEEARTVSPRCHPQRDAPVGSAR